MSRNNEEIFNESLGQAVSIVYCIDKKDVIDYATVGSFPLSPSFQINSQFCLLVSEKVKRIRLNRTKKASSVCISSRFYSPDCEETGSKRGRARHGERGGERERETETQTQTEAEKPERRWTDPAARSSSRPRLRDTPGHPRQVTAALLGLSGRREASGAAALGGETFPSLPPPTSGCPHPRRPVIWASRYLGGGEAPKPYFVPRLSAHSPPSLTPPRPLVSPYVWVLHPASPAAHTTRVSGLTHAGFRGHRPHGDAERNFCPQTAAGRRGSEVRAS